MRLVVRRFLACLLCAAGLACLSPGVSDAAGAGGESSPSVLGGPLGGESLLDEGGQQAAAEARLTSPEAIRAREESRMKFEGLDAEHAARLAAETFPAVVNVPAGGPPPLPAGQSITGYLTSTAAEVDVGGGRQAVLDSMQPIATQTSSGGLVPVNLSLLDKGTAFEPATPVAAVRIPKRLSLGVALPGVGVSLVPVDGSGAPLGGSEGVVDGAAVLYANTQTDMDSLVKPTTEGFEADTLLRSVESPRQLFFRVGLPEGASLAPAKAASGVVDVVREGTVIMTVLPVGAQDAAGSSVPVSMSVSGDTLVLNVEDRSAEYQYPIEVDPTFTEEHYTPSGGRRSNWQWESSNSSRFASKPTDNTVTKELGEASPEFLETSGAAAYVEAEKSYWAYQTQGDSKIYEFTGETEAKNTEDHIESFFELEAHGTGSQESKEVLSTEAEKTAEYARKPAAPICPKNSKGEQECFSTAGGAGNAVRFQQSVVNKPSSKYSFSDLLYKGEVFLSEPAGTHSTTKYNTSASELEIEVENAKKEKVKEKRKNALYGSGSWLSEYIGALEFVAEDPGIGVAATRLEYESSPGKWEQISEHNYLTEGNCTGVQCNPKHTELWTLNTKLPNGNDKIRYRAEDAMGAAKRETESLEAEGTATVKVDYSKPHELFVAGLPYGNELSEKTYELTTYATDGTGATIASSGIGTTELFVDGKSIKDVSEEETGKNTEGMCSAPAGECTASAKYKIKGAELGAGHHAIVIVAKDRAGNEGREEETISIRHSTPVPLGPGSVDLESGDFTLGPSDVSLGSGLSVSRVYSSRDLTAGAEGGSLLGPQWSLSIGSEATLTELVDGSVLVTSGNGGRTIFAAVLNSERKPTGKFEAPPGDSNLTMTLEENEKKEKLAYYLKDPAVGTSTKFSPSSTSTIWVPTLQEGPVSTATVSYLYETVEVGGKKVTRPKEELAAHPKVSCSPKMEPGCRALKFTYATKTKSEIGEGPSQWGEYEGRLSKVSYEGYNPATKKMTETPVPVAEYVYDKPGRLRGEWDPRVTPNLKMTYGYDPEGHVTALNPPGEEPWTFTYGTIAGDAGTGRLLKVTQAPTTAGLWNGEAVNNTGVPAITGKAILNVRLAVSTGGWSGSPSTYSYQWEDCNTKGEACTLIPGADNANYTPTLNDEGHTLVALVTVTNGGGSATAESHDTSAVKAAEIIEYSVPKSRLNSIATGPDGNLWFTNEVTALEDTGEGEVGKITTGGVVTSYDTKSDAPQGMTVGPNKNLWFVERFGGGVDEITTSGTLTRYHVTKSPTYPTNTSITSGPGGESNLWLTEDQTTNLNDEPEPARIIKISTGGTVGAEYEEGVGVPRHIIVGPDGNLWFVWPAGNKISKMTTKGVVTNYELPEGSEPWDIVSGPNGNLWFVDTGTAKIGQITTSGVIKEYALPTGSKPNVLAPGPGETLWVTEPGTSRISRVSSTGVVTLEIPLPFKGGDPSGITEGPDKNMWFTQQLETTIGKINLKPTEGAVVAPGPGTTIDYNVPVSGSGAPYSMSASEVAKWGQKTEEAPEEATAIIPSDSPQGWPASSYSRASVYYLDNQGRLVNTANPSTGTYGAISTTEYNETNDVVRTLSPDNRATALGAGIKSQEVANLLSTFNTYKNKCSRESEFNEERGSTETGTRLCETEGPAHAVKYVAGKEEKEAPYARGHVRYFYDEKVPSEGPNKESFANQTFNLLTETKSLTEIVNSKGAVQEEVEPRTAVTSYSGQNHLGWKLRESTSVTVEPEGAKVTHTTLYYEEGNEAMGQVMETRGPKGSAGSSAHDQKVVYYSQEENKEYTACGKHAEWAGLVCETLPAKQPPETTGVPKLPETTTTYNIWDEPATAIEAFPKTATFPERTRTKKTEYDSSGRMTTSEETSTASSESTDKPLPTVTNVYNETTGMLEKQSTTVGGKTKSITSTYTTLGQLETQTDADGNIAKFKWGGPEKDGLLEEMSDSSREGKSNQRYTYNETTKQLTTLVDSAAETFTASYDTEGKLTSEVYPNGMCANYTNNSVGETTHIEYTMTSSCSEKEGVWFSEARVPSARGETMSRTSTLASENYTYDTLGRLTEVQETPAGEYCKTRSYAYEEESNRTEFTMREPNSKKECAAEGGTVEKHTYDEANRLTDSGIAYDPLGNVTKLPAGDAEGHALESIFYVDNAVAAQTQNGVTNNYYLDSAGRVRETVTSGKKVITHYDGSGEAVAWTCEGAEKAETCEATAKWTRNIPGIDGALAAIQNGKGATAETPVLQLHDLQGNVVATTNDKAGETELQSKYNSTEFGVPNGGKEPPKYAWLGAGGVEKSLASGVVTEGATSYVPQTGRALQSEEVAPPGLPDGSGAGAAYILEEEPWVLQGATREADEAPGLEAGREREAFEAACRATPGVCEASTETGIYDPEGLASYNETTERAGQLRTDSENTSVFSKFCALAPPGWDAVCGAGGEVWAATLQSSAAALERCVALGRATPGNRGAWGMCFINETRTPSLPIVGLSLPLYASATVCTFEKQKKAVNYYNCEGRRKVTGPLWRHRN
jgi:streptogramin lyase